MLLASSLRAASLIALAAALFTASCVDARRGSGEDDAFEDDEYDDDFDDFADDDPCEDTPLVLSFDNSAVEYASELDSAYFDIGQHDESMTTYWPTPKSPWLARDVNDNGTIDDGAELLGSETVLESGHKAAHGFVALGDLDLNGDGRVDGPELAKAGVLVWRDADSDRSSGDGELSTAEAARILWIDLPASHRSRSGSDLQAPPPPTPLCDEHGNCEIARSEFAYLDENGVEQRGTVIDINLPYFPRPGFEPDPDDSWEETGEGGCLLP